MWIFRSAVTVSIPVSKATSWLGQAARPFRGSSRSAAELSFHGLMWPASSIRLATPGDGFKPQKTHRRPQLVSTFNAKTCCPTREAVRTAWPRREPFGCLVGGGPAETPVIHQE